MVTALRSFPSLAIRQFSKMSEPERFEKIKSSYVSLGYKQPWIDARIQGMITRQGLLNYWSSHGIKSHHEFADLTAVISKETFGMRPSEYKKFKGLKDENLRDHMSELELNFVYFGEQAALCYSEAKQPFGYQENKLACLTAGTLAKQSLEQLETAKNIKIVSALNFIKSFKS